jgi:thiamine pyrophosphokinase
MEAAIFDCDGTILDSMPMWADSCIGLLRNYGVADAEKIFYERESLDMFAKCAWYHQNLGIGESGEALYRELWHTVERAYATEVRPYEGCERFLRTLKEAGVPCVIVSSTPPELLKSALRMHGLDGYFEEVIFAGDVGRGKEHPDCYLHAGRRLGTTRESTWVFEDAPFGVRSAVRAGFPTAAILNDHDGRDPEFLELWATVVARSYDELSLDRLATMAPHVVEALVVAGSPESSSPELVADLAKTSSFVVAADKGAEVLHAAGVRPDAFCGDEDSVNEQSRDWARTVAAQTDRHPVEKDDSDLGLAIALARAHAEEKGSALRITVTCASGGRTDHALGVWGVLAKNADVAPRLVEDKFEARVLSPAGVDSWQLKDAAGTTVSVLALCDEARVTERGMRWELDGERLGLLDDRGLSNYVVRDDALIRCDKGTIAAFVMRG